MDSKNKINGFSLLIPTWNNLSYLQLCIDSILQHSTLQHQIIVLINEGKDGTKEWIESQPNLDSIYFAENAGICHTLNAGAKLAETDYILYINDDMYVLPGWDLALKEEIEKIGHNNFFLSSTMIEPTDTGNNCVIVKDFGKSVDNFRKEELLNEYTLLHKVDWNGATWPPNVMHKNLWNAIDGMSVEFSPGMYSDPDLSMKLWQQGVRYFKGLGNSKVYHFGTKSTSRINQTNGANIFKTKSAPGANIFLKKWGITPGTFAKYYLRRGEKFEGPLAEVKLGLIEKLKNKIKKAIK